jgi:hypothetical protein
MKKKKYSFFGCEKHICEYFNTQFQNILFFIVTVCVAAVVRLSEELKNLLWQEGAMKLLSHL